MRGKKVYKRRATILKNNGKVAIWNRAVKDSRITYSINHEHPLVADILEQVPKKIRHRLEYSFRMIADSFPLDVYYNDAANDKVDIQHGGDDETAGILCERMIKALTDCGVSGEELRKRLISTEIPGATEQMIDELLKGDEVICKE